MKREIKFRAWDKVHECYLYDVQGAYDTLSGCVKYENGEDADYDEECFAGFLDNDQYVVEQYTGLHDKNGREIYEGDIIKYHLTREYGENYDPITLGFIGSDWSVDADIFGEVRIWPSNGVMMTRIVTDDPEMFDKEHPVPNRRHVNQECEVVGNIYENPELLEAQHE
ncbi:hypothetical protein LCA211_2897 [Lacticaseibacillus casei 21/1]|nr:hypothetical protein LCA211_2897 [Lacticaseibacillus casei 21/1]